jgi:pimeloyl-ACP methyl ester carboxylesterase
VVDASVGGTGWLALSGLSQAGGKAALMVDDEVTFRHSQVAVAGSSLHVVEIGDPEAVPFLFLHGWPEPWQSWLSVMTLASRKVRAIAIDLPGIGGSTGDPTDGSKRQVTAAVHGMVVGMGLSEVTVVGQDVGGMVAYSYARDFGELARVVVMDVCVPGLAPWEEVLRNPYIWHFGLHAIPDLPERLVRGRQADYFSFFYNAMSADPSKITLAARAAYVKAYSTDSALRAGFNWYRTFPQDAAVNKAARDQVGTPLLYLRGEKEGGRMADYQEGFESAGLTKVDYALVSDAGHFTQEEAPEQTWRLIADFAEL